MTKAWTPQQQAVILEVANSTNSLRVDAVAGSGKTTTLLHAARGLNPSQRTLALAFNKAIADELARKFPPFIQCKTMNSLGNQVWSAYQGRKKLDTRKMGKLVTEWLKKNATPEEADELWRPLQALVSALKSSGYVPAAWIDRAYIGAEALTLEVVEDTLEAQDQSQLNPDLMHQAAESILLSSISQAFTTCIDFDDQIYMSTYFAPEEHWPQYDNILVDEAQDLSTLQHDMLSRLGTTPRMIVVGDERQAIYGWRGASCQSLNQMTSRFNLQRMPLTVSFRCPAQVIAEAQRIVPNITGVKQGGSVQHKGHEWFAEDIMPGSAVLCRNNAPLIQVGFALIRAGTPCFFTGKDIAKGLTKILQDLPTEDASAELKHTLQDWYIDEKTRLESKGYLTKLDQVRDKYYALLALLEGTNAKTIDEWVRGVERLFIMEPSPGAVELSTIHKSKGKEWDTVYFLNVHMIPGHWLLEARERDVPGVEELLEQEENLKYVAITRALDTLIYIDADRNTPIKFRNQKGV